MDGKKVIHNLEAVGPCRIINAGDIGYLGELRSRMVFEEGEDGNDGWRCDVDSQLVFPDGELLDIPGKARDEIAPIGMQGLPSRGVLFGTVSEG